MRPKRLTWLCGPVILYPPAVVELRIVCPSASRNIGPVRLKPSTGLSEGAEGSVNVQRERRSRAKNLCAPQPCCPP